ncbi:MAG: sulfide/dihydroorotate dehydrogenase-like FAD/NAD-binding protein [Candidatus Omnitrophica bacterium]|nr:sulfide/dihydroorotate dehydrogenase-like FAD/NAD-binding protein [Candidatus Omnitrophota bacterium]
MPGKNEIIHKEDLNSESFRLCVYAPEIVRKHLPGQFVILRVHEDGERIPLSVVGTDSEKGLLDMVVQVAGKTTRLLSGLSRGDSILDVVGPLGRPTGITKVGNVVTVGGGVGIAGVVKITRAFLEEGNTVTGIIGARSRDMVILEREMRAACHTLHVATDDGSAGKKGFVTDILRGLIGDGQPIDEVLTVGPLVMMKAVADLTRPHGIRTVASLNTLMVDGTGMCGCCRCTVDGQMKFACVDGPEFDAHKIDFEELLRRQYMYADLEKTSCETCRIEENLQNGG